MPASAAVSTPASAAASPIAPASSAVTPGGPPSVGVGRRDWPASAPARPTTTAWIFVPPRSMPPR
jgi:hypothetical protein